MQKYYVLDWPECQEFIGNEECYPIADGMMMAVPIELYDGDLHDAECSVRVCLDDNNPKRKRNNGKDYQHIRGC